MTVYLPLNEKQQKVVDFRGHAVVVACPGSGKTRLLARRLLDEAEAIKDSKKFALALTYTNRAAEELQHRIDNSGVDTSCVWAGTIHSFCLEWIIRPYGGYHSHLARGYSIIDEYEQREILDRIKTENGIRKFENFTPGINRGGVVYPEKYKKACVDYYKYIHNEKKLDFSLILYLSYKILSNYPSIAKNLSNIFSLVCVDEYQDTHDLQYAIIGKIIREGDGKTNTLFVGDPDQSIYDGLGGVAKSVEEISAELNANVDLFQLNGCYRSTQKIVEFYSRFSASRKLTESKLLAAVRETAVHRPIEVSRENLEETISQYIRDHIEAGVRPSEICVVAPQRHLVFPLARALRKYLPEVPLDAPGLSPLPNLRSNVWYELARIALIRPGLETYVRRRRLAKSLIVEMDSQFGTALQSKFDNEKMFLRFLNSVNYSSTSAEDYLDHLFDSFIEVTGVDLDSMTGLKRQYESFWSAFRRRVESTGLPTDLESLKNCFSERYGVLVNTCHGVKGEEFEVVIAFGLLRGYVPHWDVVINNPQLEDDVARRLLYVVFSRAKRVLHIITETGRKTNNQREYVANPLLNFPNYSFDSYGSIFVKFEDSRGSIENAVSSGGNGP
ncbi:ATP-dependent DNA helicase PcrA [compost metagenome]